MAIAMRMEYTVELDAPLREIPTQTLMVRGDKQANEVRVTVMDKGTPANLAGCEAYAYFIQPTGDKVRVEGHIDGHVITVLLSEQCYYVPGSYAFLLHVTQGTDVQRTMLWLTGRLISNGEGRVIDPGSTLPSVDELEAYIKAMDEALADTRAAAEQAREAADAAQEFVGLTVTATTLPTGQEATANFANGVLTLGLPRGAKGDTGSASAMKVNGIEGIDDNITITGGDIPRAAGNSQTIAAALTAAEEAAAEAAQAAQEAAAKPAYTPNLLDNSDFVHPVNQRKQESYAVNGYTIDRWRTWADTATVELTANGMVTGGTLYQYLQIDPDATYTAAVCRVDGSVVCVSGTPRAGMRLNPIAVVVGGNGLVTFTFTAGSYKWAALYKGAYTPSTLPLYVPKGRAAELAECMRYYQVREMLCKATGWDRYDIGAMINMRITPTVALKQFTNYGTGTITDMTGCTLNLDEWYIHYATLPTVSDHYDNGTLHAELSADL